MAKIKQPYDEPRQVPWLDDRIVNPGQVVEIPDAQLVNYLESGWKPADTATKRAADDLTKDDKQEADVDVDR